MKEDLAEVKVYAKAMVDSNYVRDAYCEHASVIIMVF